MAILGMCAFWGGSAHAIPALQLYIEGAVYDTVTDTWIGSGTGSIRLWTIGNVGNCGPISSVKLSIAYNATDTPTFTLTPSTTGNYAGYGDPSTPATPTFIRTVTDGSVPTLTGGAPLPAHGVYGVGTAWAEYGLGNFTLIDSPSGDFIDSLPPPIPLGNAAHPGSQINVYEILIAGTDEVHFDLYDSIVAGNHTKYKFAPFSHDAGGTIAEVPDGGMTLVLLGLSLFGLGVFPHAVGRSADHLVRSRIV